MKRTTKFASLVLCLVLLLGTAVGFVSSAAGETYAAKITSQNVVYGEKMFMAIAVETTETTVGVATYASIDADEPIHTSYKKNIQGEYEYYVTYGIAAKEINTTFYYAVVDAQGNEISERLAYSVAQYATEKLAETGISAKQKKLYNAILEYGDAADNIFGTNK